MLELYPVFPINPELNQIDYYWFDKGFSNVEIRNVLRISKLYEFEEALTQSEIAFNNGQKEEDTIRKSNIKWMAPEADKTEWIYYKLMQQVLEANFNLWKFDLSHIKDAIQYTEYSDEYRTPVLTANKGFILGYTNELNGIYGSNLPA